MCKKFQENAKKIYPSIYRDFYIDFEHNNHLSQYRVKCFLSIFGHLLRSISWDFKVPSTLKRLSLVTSEVNSMNWIPEIHPNLIEIKLYNISGLNDEMIIEFQALNPQLQSFNILDCNSLSSSILHGVTIFFSVL